MTSTPVWLGVGIVVLALLVGTLAGCSGGGKRASVRRETILYTEANDQRAGEQASLHVGGEMGFVDAPALQAYVEAVGQRLAHYAPRGRFPYQFRIVDQDAPNAFALPGGYIYVSRGLLILANSEDELAGVLGHEIIHVAARHAASQQALIRGLSGPMKLLASGSVARFGRDQEREADRLGQGLAGLAGYDPDGLAVFLRSMEFEERLALGGSRHPRFYDSHPATAERVATAAGRARNVSWSPKPEIAGSRAAYLQRIDGLVVGTSASEGVFQGEHFLQPELGFGLRFPHGWTTQNTRQAVGAISPRHDAVVFLEQQAYGASASSAAQAFLSGGAGEGLRVGAVHPVRIGALEGARVEGRASGLSILITWVAYDGSVYRITGVSRPPIDRYKGSFRAVARSFRPLTADAQLEIRERRLRIVTAHAGETLPALSSRSENRWNLQETAVMNDFFADVRFRGGELVKVAVEEAYSKRHRPPASGSAGRAP